jgi:hypothetical protein
MRVISFRFAEAEPVLPLSSFGSIQSVGEEPVSFVPIGLCTGIFDGWVA